MTVVPSELGLTNKLSPSSPLYYVTRECSSSSSLSPMAHNHQGMERPNNNRFKNSSYSNANNGGELSYFEKKRKMGTIHQRQVQNDPDNCQLPERLQPLVAGHEHLGNTDVMSKWVASFLPKPEPPRFFRPLCARLSRHQLRLREEQAECARRYAVRMEEVRTRLAMSVSEVRAEQKAMLRELRQQRKRGGDQKKREESDDKAQKKREENDGKVQRKREENDGREQQQRNGTDDGEQRNGNDRSKCDQPRTTQLDNKDQQQLSYMTFPHFISIRNDE